MREWPCKSEADPWSTSRQGSRQVRLCLQCCTDHRSLSDVTVYHIWQDVQAQKLCPVHTHLLICMDERAGPCLVGVKMLWGLVRVGLRAAAGVQVSSSFPWTCSLLCHSCHTCSRAFQTQIQIDTILEDMILMEVFTADRGHRYRDAKIYTVRLTSLSCRGLGCPGLSVLQYRTANLLCLKQQLQWTLSLPVAECL